MRRLQEKPTRRLRRPRCSPGGPLLEDPFPYLFPAFPVYLKTATATSRRCPIFRFTPVFHAPCGPFPVHCDIVKRTNDLFRTHVASV